jgi:hypothetical protein
LYCRTKNTQKMERDIIDLNTAKISELRMELSPVYDAKHKRNLECLRR